MPDSLPLPLFFARVIFFGFLNTHQRHAARFQGASQVYLFALHVSTLIGALLGLGLLAYYFLHVAWCWPLILFVVGSLIAGLAFGLIDVAAGTQTMSLLAFIGWPAAAVWVFLIIRAL